MHLPGPLSFNKEIACPSMLSDAGFGEVVNMFLAPRIRTFDDCNPSSSCTGAASNPGVSRSSRVDSMFIKPVLKEQLLFKYVLKFVYVLNRFLKLSVLLCNTVKTSAEQMLLAKENEQTSYVDSCIQV